VVFAAGDPKRGALGGCLNLAIDASAHHAMEVVGGIGAQAAKDQLERWFRRRRRQALPKSGYGKPAAPAPTS
jgi:tRNA(adenine34) deaminase